MRPIKIIVEKHPEGYVAYPPGNKREVGEVDPYKEALEDVKSAIKFHIERKAFETEGIIETFVAEVAV